MRKNGAKAMRKTSGVAAAVTILLGASSYHVSATAAEDQEPGASNGDESSNVDIADMSRQLGVSEDELRLERDLLPELSALSAFLGERPGFTQLWITWGPFRVNAEYTSAAGDEVRSALAGFSRQDLLVHHHADLDFKQLELVLQRVVILRDKLGSDTDVSIDASAEAVEVIASPASVQKLTEAAEADTELARSISDGVLRVSAGSTAATTTSGGGTFANGCSAAFIVTGGSDYGVLGAGHAGCNGDTTYTDLATNYPTTDVFHQTQGRRDVAIQKLSSGTPLNQYRVPFPPGFRAVNATQGWSGMTIGQSVCMKARTSGWTCGNILTKNYSPTYVPGGERFIEMSNTCQFGDSGGLWADADVAYGVQSGKRSNNHCLFGAIDYAMAGTGWSVKTS